MFDWKRYLPVAAVVILIAPAVVLANTFRSPQSARSETSGAAGKGRTSPIAGRRSFVRESIPVPSRFRGSGNGVIRVKGQDPGIVRKPVSPPSEPTLASASAHASWKDRYRGKIVNAFPTRKKVVALTFDDGPNGLTPAFTGILTAYHDHATFFFRGRGIPASEVKAAVDAGDEIGNHTRSHVPLRGLSPKRIASEIDQINDQLVHLTGHKPVWVRAQGGRIGPAGMRAVQQRGQLYAYWDDPSGDTVFSEGPADIAQNVMNRLHPGAIILMHQTRFETLEALPALLVRLKAKGYHTVTLSQLAAMTASTPLAGSS